MNPSSYDIAQMINDELGMVLGVDIFIAQEPTSPDECITLFDLPSRGPAISMSGNDPDAYYEYPAIQIRSRGREYLETWERIRKVVGVLHGASYRVINGTTYCAIICNGGPGLLDQDQNSRFRLYANIDLQRR